MSRNTKSLAQYYQQGEIEVGIDEAGRGCLFGPVCVAAVIWLEKDPREDIVIKDSKRYSEKKRHQCAEYIQEYCPYYSVQMISNDEIDSTNILQATLKGMHQCLDDICEKTKVDTILVDGTQFKPYYCSQTDEFLNYHCVIKGDDTFKSIAAASVLAKTFRDNYIKSLVQEHPELEKYGLLKHKGYGTKAHMEAIKTYGITPWHRKSFEPCKSMVH
jgi:ribonuclease HII